MADALDPEAYTVSLFGDDDRVDVAAATVEESCSIHRDLALCDTASISDEARGTGIYNVNAAQHEYHLHHDVIRSVPTLAARRQALALDA